MNPETKADPGESLVSLIAQLHDLREPQAVSMWPETDAWWVLAVILTLLVAFGIWRWLRHRRANAYRREALARLRDLEPELSKGDPAALARLDQILRRTALAAFPRGEVAALTGTDWADYLDRSAKGLPPPGFGGISGALAEAAYKARPPAFDGAEVARLARYWIRHHHA